MEEDGTYLYKEGCDDCGSSDAKAVYSSGTTYCFSCAKHSFTEAIESSNSFNKGLAMQDYTPTFIESVPLIRCINKQTLSKFNYGISNGKHITYYFDELGSIVAEKYRTKDKGFSWVGNAKKASLFGQNLWKPNKKISLTVTEGEIDAMSISQIQLNKYPVVSVPNGAAAATKDIKKSLEWILGFKELVICFDNDKVGQEAALSVAKLFPPKFVRIAVLPKKDANEMLANGLITDLSNALRDAKPFTPDGILTGNTIIDRLMEEKDITSYPFPDFMSGTNEKTLGIRMGELDTFTSSTGSGKTTLIKQLQHHYLNSTEMNQAIIHLEEPLEHTAKDLVGIDMDIRVQLNKNIDKKDYIECAKTLFNRVDDQGNNRLCLYDSFGSIDTEDLYNKIRFMVNGLDCKIIWLDHLSILVSGLGQAGDERRAIDAIMHGLKSLTIELGCYIGLVVHLNNNTQTPFEEGAIPTINNLRGSGGIKQLSNQVYAFSRNQMAETIKERNTSTFTVLKSRFTGNTGNSDTFFYNNITGKLEKPQESSFEGEDLYKVSSF